MKTLQTIQNELRDLVPQGTDLVLAAFKKTLKPGSDKYNDYLALEGRYQDVSRQLLQGIISNEDATLEFNRIRQALIDFIDSIRESDIPELATATNTEGGIADVYNGEVLYRIPKKMQLGVEEECIVRLSFDRKKLLHDFQVEVGDVMKDLRISDVMGVELLDPNSEKAFTITTLHDTVQFVEKDLVTEWIFCVTPLKEGQFPLVLKISIIEIINGIERKRNEVLKEQVEILTQKPTDAATDFISAGYSWQLTDTDEQRAVPGGGGKGIDTAFEPLAPPPSAPKPAPAPMPQAPSPSKSGGFRKIATVLGAVLALVISVWAVIGNMGNNSSDVPLPSDVVKADTLSAWDKTRIGRDRGELEAFVSNNPGTAEAQMAQQILDTLEMEAWETALASNDAAAMSNYLASYPEGKYVDAASIRMWEIEQEVLANEQITLPDDGAPETQDIAKDATNKGTGTTGQKPKKPTKQPPKKTPIPSKTPTKPAPTPEKEKLPSIEAEKPKPVDPNKPVTVMSTSRKPVFKGCDNKDRNKEEKCTADKIYKYLRNGFRYPQKALDNSIEGTVNVSFIIERDGSVTDVHATNDIGGGCAAEAIRLVKKLPKFKPGQNAKGQPVRVLYNQPVRFQLE